MNNLSFVEDHKARGEWESMTNPAKYKLATQAILMAYELLAPDPRSADDLKQHLANMQINKINRLISTETVGTSQSILHDLDREIFFECMTAFDEGLKHYKWFYRD